jgi:hypothetical protein
MTSVWCVSYSTGVNVQHYVMQFEAKHCCRANTTSRDLDGTTWWNRSVLSTFWACYSIQQRWQSEQHITLSTREGHFSLKQWQSESNPFCDWTECREHETFISVVVTELDWNFEYFAFVALTTAAVSIIIFWYIKPCSLVETVVSEG